MSKKHTNLTIDTEVLKEAKEKFFNMSQIAEDAIREKLGKEIVEIDTTATECEFCGAEGKPESADTINLSRRGLTWLFPDERWVCNTCLKQKGRMILK